MATKSRRWSLRDLFGLKQGQKKQQQPSPRSDNTYHAVSIIPGSNACAAVQGFLGQRFLSRQAPPLPLPTCDAAECNCKYRHHKDRRAGPRRRSDKGLMPAPYAGAERRQSRGRRADDV